MGKKRSKLFILGTYGCGNRGDEAILASIVSYFHDDDIWITNGRYDDMRKYFPVKTVRCRLAEGKITLAVFLSILFHSFHQLYRILRADALIYGGGSSIHDLTSYNLVYMFFWQWVAQLFGKKVFYLGMGIGPITTPRGKKLCQTFLNKADGVYARDERGYQLCMENAIHNVKHSADLAFYDNVPAAEQAAILARAGFEANRYITVSACQWFTSTNFWNRANMDFAADIENFAGCLDVLHSFYHLPLVFMPTFSYDAQLGQALQNRLGSNVLTCYDEKASLVEMSEIIANAHLHFGMRMHSIIFAMRRGGLVLPVIYDEKVSELLNHFSLGDQIAINLEVLTPNSLHAKLTEVERSRGQLVANIKSVKDMLYLKAKESLDATRAELERHA